MTQKTNPSENFYQRLPYHSLSTRHYKRRWKTKTKTKPIRTSTYSQREKEKQIVQSKTGQGAVLLDSPASPGYYQNYHQFFDYPNHLQNFYFGHSQYGDRYQDLMPTKSRSKKFYDVKNPKYKYDYPAWYDYQPRPWQTWHSGYIGFPWHYY